MYVWACVCSAACVCGWIETCMFVVMMHVFGSNICVCSDCCAIVM